MRPYHSFNDSNSLINLRVNGLQEFADELLNTDDYYACFTTKYLNFMTGYDIPLDSWKDIEEESQIHRDIRRWSDELKSNGDMKQLLLNIINSNYFME